MKHLKTITTVALVATISLGCTCVFATENTNSTESKEGTRRKPRFAAFVSEETVAERKEAFAATLEEKLEAGKITQEQYDKIVSAMESGAWSGMGGRVNGNIPFAGNREEMTSSTLEEKLEAGEITQEQYDKIVSAMESHENKGMAGRFNWKAENGESTENVETEEADGQTAERGRGFFGNFKGMNGRANGRTNGRAWRQITEESAE